MMVWFSLTTLVDSLCKKSFLCICNLVMQFCNLDSSSVSTLRIFLLPCQSALKLANLAILFGVIRTYRFLAVAHDRKCFAKGESKALLYQREYFSTSRIRISKFWSGCFSRVASQVNRLSYCSFCNTTHDTHRERVL